MAGIVERLERAAPYQTPQAPDPRRRRLPNRMRVVAYALLLAALMTPVIQFAVMTERTARRTAGGQASAPAEAPGPSGSKAHWGAIGRWREHIRLFWQGRNIYDLPPRPARTNGDSPAYLPVAGRAQPVDAGGEGMLHPNMPFTVILLTPFAYMPVLPMAIAFNLLKLAAFLAALLMAVRLADHGQRRMPDWVVGLALLWSLRLIIADIQHGNTNLFVLAAVVLHLWLYRAGRDLAAGAALALAICLKMTPAIFLLYWLYQRNWRLLAATAASGIVMAVLIPAAAVGPARCAALTKTWLDNLIRPGLIEEAWYPVHVNQSLPAVAGRYFLGHPHRGGDIFWSADDDPYYLGTKHGWIALAALSPRAVKTIIRLGQLAIMGVLAWAIGWRKLPRDDGRRAIHYGLVLLAMLLLNQRTWDHHAGVLLLADLGVWYAVAFGRMSRPARATAFALMLAAGPLVWLGGTDVCHLLAGILGRPPQDGALWADYFKAYGPTFWHFVLLFAGGAILAVALKKPQEPYAETRQKLTG